MGVKYETLKTRDGVELAITRYPSNRKGFGDRKGSVSPADARPLIVVPGFAQHSSTATFRSLCSELARDREVICVDLRGTGRSSGRFGFGSDEFRDVEAAVTHVRTLAGAVDVLAFSLGAYSSLRAAAELGAHIDRLFLVSVPTSSNHIVWRGHGLRHVASVLKKRERFKKERDLRFRWANPFARKPSAEDFARVAKCETHFLVGTHDVLVPVSMSRQIFDAMPNELRSWSVFDGGEHAELLYFLDPERFRAWLDSPAESGS